jgi:hypothetical protein
MVMQRLRQGIKLLLGLALMLNLFSCSKEDIGVRTVIKGRVSDQIRGINISGYKICLVKSWRECENFMCGAKFEEIATTYTDENGNYTITFNHKLNAGESYGLLKQYYSYENPYHPEYTTGTGIAAGVTNTININAWKPVELRLNLEVVNNANAPLMVGNAIDNSSTIDNSTTMLFNVENIYEQNITKTYVLRSRPNSDIRILFWYHSGNNSSRRMYEKTIPYRTTAEEVNTLSYKIDCSTFQ